MMIQWETLQRIRLCRQWEDDVDGTILEIRPEGLLLQFDDEPHVRRVMDYASAAERLIPIRADGSVEPWRIAERR